jgi:hypothetical protein
MKFATRMLLLGMLVMLAIPVLPGQDRDLSGTWVGSTEVPNREEKDNLTLVLKKEGATYTGTITDTMGMLNAAVLEKVKFEKDTISFEFLALVGNEQIRIKSTLKVSEDKMVGSWESEQGDTGALDFVRKK